MSFDFESFDSLEDKANELVVNNNSNLYENWENLKGVCSLKNIKFLSDDYGVKFEIHLENEEFVKAFKYNLPKSSDSQKGAAFKLMMIKRILGDLCGYSSKEISLKKTKELYKEACEFGKSSYKYLVKEDFFNDKVIQKVSLTLKERGTEKIDFLEKPEERVQKTETEEDIPF